MYTKEGGTFKGTNFLLTLLKCSSSSLLKPFVYWKRINFPSSLKEFFTSSRIFLFFASEKLRNGSPDTTQSASFAFAFFRLLLSFSAPALIITSLSSAIFSDKWLQNFLFTSRQKSFAPGFAFLRIAFVKVPIPGPSSTITFDASKSILLIIPFVRNLELGSTAPVSLGFFMKLDKRANESFILSLPLQFLRP